MSDKAVVWVSGLGIEYIKDPTDLAIMRCIANYCNESHIGVVSYAMIAHDSRCSEDTVRRRMSHLTDDKFGHMKRGQARGDDGRKTKSVFRLNVPKSPPDNLRGGPVQPPSNLQGGAPETAENRQSHPPRNLQGGQKSPPDNLQGGEQKAQQNSHSSPPDNLRGGRSGRYNKTPKGVFYISPAPGEQFGKVVPGGKPFEVWKNHYRKIGHTGWLEKFAEVEKSGEPVGVISEYPPGYEPDEPDQPET